MIDAEAIIAWFKEKRPSMSCQIVKYIAGRYTVEDTDGLLCYDDLCSFIEAQDCKNGVSCSLTDNDGTFVIEGSNWYYKHDDAPGGTDTVTIRFMRQATSEAHA